MESIQPKTIIINSNRNETKNILKSAVEGYFLEHLSLDPRKYRTMFRSNIFEQGARFFGISDVSKDKPAFPIFATGVALELASQKALTKDKQLIFHDLVGADEIEYIVKMGEAMLIPSIAVLFVSSGKFKKGVLEDPESLRFSTDITMKYLKKEIRYLASCPVAVLFDQMSKKALQKTTVRFLNEIFATEQALS